MRLAGKVAVIVGAGQTAGDTIGNGRATALLFAREGAKLLLVDRDEPSLAETARMIRDEGAEVLQLAVDATRPEAADQTVAMCREAYGCIDILHNNVGIGTGDGEASAVSLEAWDRILEVNLKSALVPCQHVLPVMREQQRGAITNISSLAAVAAAVDLTAYKVSKAGLNALTEVMAIANARYGIRVNAIMPGLIETPMAIDGVAARSGLAKEEVIRQRNARVPLGHMGTAWDVAYAALFLASDEAKFITGAILPVDGGQGVRVG